MAWDATAMDAEGGDILQVFHLGAQLTTRMYEDPDDVKQVIIDSAGVALPIISEFANFVHWQVTRAERLAHQGKAHDDLESVDRWLDHVIGILARARTAVEATRLWDSHHAIAPAGATTTGIPAGTVPPGEKED